MCIGNYATALNGESHFNPLNTMSIIPRAIRSLIYLSGFAALAPAATYAANYYVSPNGNDSAVGTLDAPFASIMRAQSAATAGDTVVVRGGTYATFAIAATDSNYNYVHVLNKSGVTYAAYPGETPVFDF